MKGTPGESGGGRQQCYYTCDFATTKKTLPPPEVKVTAYESSDPYKVRFNVKAPNGDAASAKYLANYDREWGGQLNQGYTYASMIEYLGNPFSPEEVALINSAEGLDLEFDSKPNMTTRLVVACYNSENTPNDVDSEGSTAIADARSAKEPDAPRVESSLFTDLEGEWTMTGKSSQFNYYSQTWNDPETLQTKVTISGALSSPKTLPEEVYKVYEAIGKSRKETDALYQEFKSEEEEYNAILRGQNRLLCLGFGYEVDDPDSYSTFRAFKTATPYELFFKEDYNGFNNKSLFSDFGPKWYLQINADGTVSVPINSEYMDPLNAWTDNIYYLSGMGQNEKGEEGAITVGPEKTTIHFPVEISDDKNTITVKPMQVKTQEGDTYTLYPTAAYPMYGTQLMFASGRRNVSELTLTRGWTEPTTPAAPASVRRNAAPAPVMVPTSSLIHGSFSPNRTVRKMKTSLNGMNMKEFKKVSITPVTKEQFEANIDKFMNERGYYRKVK